MVGETPAYRSAAMAAKKTTARTNPKRRGKELRCSPAFQAGSNYGEVLWLCKKEQGSAKMIAVHLATLR